MLSLKQDNGIEGTATITHSGTEHTVTALDETLLLLNRVVHAAVTSIVVTDPHLPDNPIIFHNPAFEHMSGYAASEIDGRNCRFLQGADTDRETVAELRRAIAEVRPCTVLLRNYRKDGTPFWNELAMSPVRDASGYLTHFVGVQTDVTRRAEAERERDVLLTQQTRIAETLQRALLLTPSTATLSGVDVSTQYLPAWGEAQFGGDFFDTVTLTENKLALVVGDCAGKGLKAAQYTAEVKYALRVLLREYGHPTPALHRLNTFLMDSHRLDARSEDALVCVVVAVMDTETGDVVVASAGMEPPLVVRASGATEIVEVRGLILGLDTEAEYKAESIHLEFGDSLVLVTDGITEARGVRPRRALFGFEGLVTVTHQAQAESLSPDAMGERVVSAAQEFAQGKLSDDVCVLIARRTTPDVSGTLDGQAATLPPSLAEPYLVPRGDDFARFALEVTGLGYWEIDTTTGAGRQSPRYDQIFGYDVPRIGWTYEDFLRQVHSDDHARVDVLFGRALASGTDWRFECRIVRAGDKAVRWIAVQGRHFRDAARGNAPTRIIGTVADISERKRTEEEILATANAVQSERSLLSATLAAIPFGVSLAAIPSGQILYRNESALRLLGYTELEIRDIADFKQYGALHTDAAGSPLHPYTPEEYPLARAVLYGESVTDHEMLYRKGDGSLTWLSVSAMPLRENAGAPVRAIATYSDISERKRREQERTRLSADNTRLQRDEAHSAERLRLAVGVAGIGTWDVDFAVDGGVNTLDARTAVLFGRSVPPGEETLTVSGAEWAGWIHPKDSPRIIHEFTNALASSVTQYAMEYRTLWADNETSRWVSVHAAIQRDAVTGKPLRVVGVCRDITNEKEAVVRQRTFLKEMLFGLTEGRLRLCDAAADLPASLSTACPSVELTPPTVRVLRKQVLAMSEQMRFDKERVQDLETAVGEAGMNAIRHAHGGVGTVCADAEKGTLQVWVRDEGNGIAEHLIHRAVERGWTTGGFGQGMFLMHRTCDRVYLLTGVSGTTVVLEQDRAAPAPAWLRNDHG